MYVCKCTNLNVNVSNYNYDPSHNGDVSMYFGLGITLFTHVFIHTINYQVKFYNKNASNLLFFVYSYIQLLQCILTAVNLITVTMVTIYV